MLTKIYTLVCSLVTKGEKFATSILLFLFSKTSKPSTLRCLPLDSQLSEKVAAFSLEGLIFNKNIHFSVFSLSLKTRKVCNLTFTILFSKTR